MMLSVIKAVTPQGLVSVRSEVDTLGGIHLYEGVCVCRLEGSTSELGPVGSSHPLVTQLVWSIEVSSKVWFWMR